MTYNIHERRFHFPHDYRLFPPVEEGEPSNLEKQLRFIYAAHALLRNVNNTHHPSRIEMIVPTFIGEYRNQSIWFPKSGSPHVITTVLAGNYFNIAQRREFVKDPLYKRFSPALSCPVSYVSFTIESNRDESEYLERITQLFEKSCASPEWKNFLLKLLPKSAGVRHKT